MSQHDFFPKEKKGKILVTTGRWGGKVQISILEGGLLYRMIKTGDSLEVIK